MRIGLLTHYLVNNQGAQLQMLSMYRYLEESGHQVYILTYEKNFDFDENEKKKNSASILHFPYYIKEYLFKKGLGLTAFNVRKAMKHKKALRGFKFLPYDTDDVDAVIIGSDEVFSIDVGCNTMMLPLLADQRRNCLKSSAFMMLSEMGFGKCTGSLPGIPIHKS